MKDENTQNKYFRIEEKLEAIIFLSKEMLKIDNIASFYDIEKKELEKILLNLKLNLFCMNGYTNNTIPKIKEDKNGIIAPDKYKSK